MFWPYCGQLICSCSTLNTVQVWFMNNALVIIIAILIKMLLKKRIIIESREWVTCCEIHCAVAKRWRRSWVVFEGRSKMVNLELSIFSWVFSSWSISSWAQVFSLFLMVFITLASSPASLHCYLSVSSRGFVLFGS